MASRKDRIDHDHHKDRKDRVPHGGGHDCITQFELRNAVSAITKTQNRISN